MTVALRPGKWARLIEHAKLHFMEDDKAICNAGYSLRNGSPLVMGKKCQKCLDALSRREKAVKKAKRGS